MRCTTWQPLHHCYNIASVHCSSTVFQQVPFVEASIFQAPGPSPNPTTLLSPLFNELKYHGCPSNLSTSFPNAHCTVLRFDGQPWYIGSIGRQAVNTTLLEKVRFQRSSLVCSFTLLKSLKTLKLREH